MFYSTFYFTLLALLLLGGCSQKPQEQLVHQQIFTFGTLVDISIWTKDKEKAQQAIQQVSADMEFLHEAWHPTKGGPLTRVNKMLKTGETFSINPSVLPLIEPASKLSIKSEGLFNPAIGLLIQLWQFDQLDIQHSSGKPLTPPDPQKVKDLLEQSPKMSDIFLNDIRVSSSNPAVELDFGAFAKGVAVNRAIEKIQQLGFKHALFNAGGDLKVLGKRGERHWRIGIRNPFYQNNKQQPVIASIELHDQESAFTSGDYERFFEYQGHHYHHIIDPRSGYPAEGFHSVTIIHPDAGLADAAATAIFIAGEKDWQRIAHKMGIDMVMIIDKNKQLIMTEKMAQRIQVESDEITQTIIAAINPAL